MKQARPFVVNALVSGLIIVVPVYLAVLLLLKAMGSVLGLVGPFAKLLPDWLPATNILERSLFSIVGAPTNQSSAVLFAPGWV